MEIRRNRPACNLHPVGCSKYLLVLRPTLFYLQNFSCNNRIESRVDFQYSGTRPLCPLRLLQLRLMLNAKIQAAAVVRPFTVDPPAVEAATKTGDETNLAGVRGIC